MSVPREGWLHVYAGGPPSAGESRVTRPVGQPLSDSKTGVRSACPSRPATALHSRITTVMPFACLSTVIWTSAGGPPLALSPSWPLSSQLSFCRRKHGIENE